MSPHKLIADLGAQSSTFAVFAAAILTSVLEDYMRIGIALIILITSMLCLVVNQVIDPWLQSLVTLVIGYYFGRSTMIAQSLKHDHLGGEKEKHK